LKRGVWETTFHTKIHPENDTETLLTMEKEVTTVFKALSDMDTNLLNLKLTLQQNIRHALQLSQTAVKRRTKRSSGIFGFLKGILFGEDDIDEQLALFRASEDQKLKHISEDMTHKIKQGDRLRNKLNMKIDHMNEGIKSLNKSFNENKKNVLIKHVTETIMLAEDIVQYITTRYLELEIQPLSIFDSTKISEKIQSRLPDGYTILDHPRISSKELFRGEIIVHIENVIVSQERFEIFHITVIPNLKNFTTLDLDENVIAINDIHYIYPTDITRYNSTHHVSSDVAVRRDLDCISSSFRHIKTECLCGIKPIKNSITKFVKLSQPNKILYYSSHPNEIYLKCNKTLTHPAYQAGVITLSQDCKIQTKNIEIQPTMKIEAVETKMYFKPLAKILNLSAEQKEETNMDQLYLIIITSTIACVATLILGITIAFIIKQVRAKMYTLRPPPFKPSPNSNPSTRNYGGQDVDDSAA